jgi:putative membrane protein insertion efficiency factor
VHECAFSSGDREQCSSMRIVIRVLVLLIDSYRLVISPLLGSHCRFEPSCSAFAREALCKHGVRRGLRLSAGRILRCRPWGAAGLDPVP